MQADNENDIAKKEFSVNVSAKYLTNSVDAGVTSVSIAFCVSLSQSSVDVTLRAKRSSWTHFNKSSASNSVVSGGKPIDIEVLTDLPFPDTPRELWNNAVGNERN
jgi:hypothetical protein